MIIINGQEQMPAKVANPEVREATLGLLNSSIRPLIGELWLPSNTPNAKQVHAVFGQDPMEPHIHTVLSRPIAYTRGDEAHKRVGYCEVRNFPGKVVVGIGFAITSMLEASEVAELRLSDDSVPRPQEFEDIAEFAAQLLLQEPRITA